MSKQLVVLLGESNIERREKLTDTFRLHDFTVHGASSGLGVEKAFREIRPFADIVVLNSSITGEEGIGTIVAIWRLNPHQKILAVATHNITRVSAMAMNRSIKVVIMNPIVPEAVVQIAMEMIGQNDSPPQSKVQ